MSFTLPRLALASLALACSAACAGIPRAPLGTSRTELEVAVRVDPSIAALLQEPKDLDSIQSIVSDAVMSLADIGLRFYPVPSANYGEKDLHPEFLLTVSVQALRAELDPKAIQAVYEAATSEGAVDKLACSARAKVERRRDSGPSLSIFEASGVGDTTVREAGMTLSSEQQFHLNSPMRITPATFKAADLQKAVQQAVRNALGQLVDPIDAEMAVGVSNSGQ